MKIGICVMLDTEQREVEASGGGVEPPPHQILRRPSEVLEGRTPPE